MKSKPERRRRREGEAESAMVGFDRIPAKRKDALGGRTRTMFRRFFITLLLIILLVEAKVYVEERTAGGQWIKRATYDYLQWLITLGDRGQPHVTIIDITSVKANQPVTLDDKEVMITPRQEIYGLLLKIIQQCKGKPPKAIGVDIDFSPTEGKLIDVKNDLGFFQACLDLSKGNKVPIFLGIKRTQEQPPEKWLYQEEFQNLAATIMLPEAVGGNEENEDNIKYMTHWLKSVKSEESEKSTRPCRSMSAALAETVRDSRGDGNWWLSWACEGFSKYRFPLEASDHQTLVEDQFLVDWSSSKALSDKKVQVVEIDGKYSIPMVPERLTDHIILLGDMKIPQEDTDPRQQDVCIVNGKKQPGVIAHACAAETLAVGQLFRLTDTGRLALDLLFSLSILGAIMAICLLYNRAEPSQEVNVEWLHHTLTRTAVVVIFFAGALLVWLTRLMWDDFVLVMLALMIHSPVERSATAGFRKLPPVLTRLRKWWNKHILEPKRP